LIETEKPLDFEQLRKDPRFPVWVGDQEYTVVHSVSMPKHQLSHRTIYANFYEIDLKQWPESLPPEALMMAREEITRYPVSRLTELYLQQNM
jgi:A/G-specific adenine glycosylase